MAYVSKMCNLYNVQLEISRPNYYVCEILCCDHFLISQSILHIDANYNVVISSYCVIRKNEKNEEKLLLDAFAFSFFNLIF